MRNSWTIALNLIKRMLGKRRGILIYIVMPCLVVSGTISLLGSASESAKTEIAYVNLDHGPSADYVSSELKRQGSYELKTYTSEKEAKEAVISQKTSSALIIPSGYSQALLGGSSPKISFYELKQSEETAALNLSLQGITGRLASSAKVAAASSQDQAAIESTFKSILDVEGQHQVDAKVVDYQLHNKQGLDSVTGFMLLFLMGLVTSSVALVMSDRQNRTMARMFSTPVRAMDIALGNFLGSLAIGAIQVFLVLGLTRWVMGFDYGLSFGIHFVILIAFILVSMGIASTVAGLIRNPQNTGMLNTMIIVPTGMLGGCFWPLDLMPDFMKKIANFMPQKWTIQAIDIAATGGGFADIWLPLAVLGLMAFILLVVGSAILRPSQTSKGA